MNQQYDNHQDYKYLPKPNTTWTPPFSSTYSHALDQYIQDIHQKGKILIQRKHHPRPSQIYLHILKTLKSLKLNPAIIIKAADKNLGLVIMNRNDYKAMCLVHLHDRNTYQLISNQFYMNQSWAKLNMILANFNLRFTNNKGKLTYFARSLCQLQHSDNLRPAIFYCLPKIHKDKTPIPGRPIVSAPSTITYYTSIYLNNIMKPLLNYLPTICASSAEAIKIFSSVKQNLPESTILLTADVKALYPSIPIQLGLDCIKNILEMSKRFTSTKINLLLSLLKWVLTNNYIYFDNQIYLQLEGTAMGTPVAPTYAIIFMFAIERHLIGQALCYIRYIDDIFAAFTSEEHIHSFLTGINSSVPDNKLQLESIVIGQQNIFLDLLISCNNGKLTHEIYHKPGNTFAYIPTSSDHPKHMFKSFVLEELKRCYRNCTDFEKFQIAANNFKTNLSNRGYNIAIFNEAYNILINQHLPMNVSPFSSRPSLPTSFHFHANHTNFHASPSSLENFNPFDTILKFQKNKVQQNLHQPILVISLPVLNNTINWKQFTKVSDDLINTLPFQKAYKSSEILISKQQPRSLGCLYICSKF
jgi:hypothetical protein